MQQSDDLTYEPRNEHGSHKMRKMILFFAGLCCALSASAQFTNRSSVLDGSGTLSSGGGFTNVSASGQSGGISVSDGSGYVNFAGFLNTFVIKAGIDTDGDGIADENDLDNDNDGLRDVTELSGSAFTPPTVTMVNLRDSDGDGLSDGQESVAGTDPFDPNAFLRMVRIQPGGGQTVGWLARSNKTYKVYYSDNSYVFPTNLMTTINANGFANAPWYAFTNNIVDATATNARFYAVEAQP